MIDQSKIQIEVWRFRAQNWIVFIDTESNEEIFSSVLDTVQAALMLAAGIPLIRTDSYGPSCNQVR